MLEFPINKARQWHKKLSHLKWKLEELEQKLNNDEAKERYYACRGEINEIYDDTSNSIKIRESEWYKFGEKSNEFFLTLEKRQATKNIICELLSNEQEITDLFKVNTHIYQFYQHLYNKKRSTSEDLRCHFLNDLAIHLLAREQLPSCEGNLTEKEIYNSFISFENKNSPDNDGLTKEFYCIFWDDFKDAFMNFLKESK